MMVTGWERHCRWQAARAIAISLVIIGLTSAAACARVRATPEGSLAVRGVSIYLVAGGVSADQARQSGLDVLLLENEPILAEEDILRYKVPTHEIEVSATAHERLEALDAPVTGLPFVVCVGDERVYGGAFWPLWSSLSYDGVTIWLPLLEGERVALRTGYPSPDFFEGRDPRSDPRIMGALKRAGKLVGKPEGS